MTRVRILLLLACAGCSTPTQPTPTPVPQPVVLDSGPFLVTGRVRDFVSGDPVQGFVFRIGTQQFTTSPDGRYNAHFARGDDPIAVAGTNVGLGVLSVSAASLHGDLLIDGGICAARYGVVTDQAGRPIAGARIDSTITTTDADGWYRRDYGCRESCFPCNTAQLWVEANGYEMIRWTLGRGVHGVERLDVRLTKSAHERPRR